MDAGDDDTLWPTEWWERAAARRERWARTHGAASTTLRRVRSVVLLLAAAWLVVAAVLLPELGSGIAAWLGATWIAFLGFVLLRTKTVSWAGFWGLFAVSLVWSVLATLLLVAVARGVDTDVESVVPSVAVAAVGEEALKLVPLLVLALLAPARVHRWSVADWMLAGLASGAAFTAAEEAIRRTSRLGNGAEVLPAGFTTFGPLGSDLGYEGPVQYAGHHVVTMLVAAAVGVGVALVRRAGRREGAARTGLLAAAGALPLLVWWCAVVRHAGLNAAAYDLPTLPWPLRATEAVLPTWWAGTTVVLLAGLAVMLLDARHLARWRDATLEEVDHPRWVRTALHRVDERLEGRSLPEHVLASVARAAVHLGHVVGRDLRQVVDAHSGSLGTKGVSAARSARTLVVMQREMRQVAFHLETDPARPRLVRLAAVLGLLLVGLAAVVGGPALAGPVRELAAEGAWFGGLLGDFARWFDGLSGFEKVTVGAAAAAGLAIAGGGAIDARTDVPDDLGTATPASLVLGLGQAALTAGLSGVDRSTSVGLHALVGDYRRDPAAWRSSQAEMLARPVPGA